MIPKVINRPIYSYNLATLGFWTFAFFGGLTGMVRLNGGPVPAWLVTLSIAANLMMLIPIATVSTNLLFTMRGHTHMVYYSPTIRFTFFGVISFTIASVVGLLSSLRSIDRVLHFTQFQAAQQHLIMGAKVAGFFQTTTIIISIPSVILLTALMLSLWGGSIRFTVPMLFATAFMVALPNLNFAWWWYWRRCSRRGGCARKRIVNFQDASMRWRGRRRASFICSW